MHIVLTTCSAVILICVALAMRRIERLVGQCEDHANDAEGAKIAMLEDRHRLTSVERDLEATRRELRKLSGKFYAELRAREYAPDPTEDDYEEPLPDHRRGIPAPGDCENWKAAQSLGPTSDAARCECLYCMTRRAERRALRAALVPKTVQGQAETAKLNAGKP